MRKKQCDHCGSDKFGLVRQNWLGFQFCKKACRAEFLEKRKRQIEQTTRWLAYLTRSPTRRAGA
jgi:hypothetical protein